MPALTEVKDELNSKIKVSNDSPLLKTLTNNVFIHKPVNILSLSLQSELPNIKVVILSETTVIPQETFLKKYLLIAVRCNKVTKIESKAF